jgi:hypothetical protein
MGITRTVWIRCIVSLRACFSFWFLEIVQLHFEDFALFLAVALSLLSHKQFSSHQITNWHHEQRGACLTFGGLFFLLWVYVRLGGVLIKVRVNKELSCPTQYSAFLFGFTFEEI